MSQFPFGGPRVNSRKRSSGWLVAVFLGALILVGANAHFVYVAVTSQPDCVPHLKSPAAEKIGEESPFRAAKSAC
ncbi:hypothetical protein [Limibacillus halophilus]|uniref:Uncharacterized protein n=1 Tax=Limibacillus halophilus TaxID=1579333 RepID=A0A839STJ5_9PROT|nr:hypothetical protein [Limibacillus halophilus]MBB3064233.1 hypothetical protein [Limibacillus halophilus]